jgi:ubiquinone/menaquinone biosynthesis C-methylase UbiE
MNIKEHWDKIFTTKTDNELSWHQAHPWPSTRLIESLNLPLDANIIDVGGGSSRLADVLLARGYQNIWVLDISEHAIEVTMKRLGKNANKIHWIISDITNFDFDIEQFDLWHDRATFHFLTTDEKINKYIFSAKKAIKQNGFLIVGTFSEKGPTKCSGLEIKQYSDISISAKFETGFERIECITEDHTTPFNTTQNFLFCRFKRK